MADFKLSSIFLALMVLLPLAAASQLNLYKGPNCSGAFTACFDRACCSVPSDAVSYKFYYNPEWRGFLFGSDRCSSGLNTVLQGDVVCANITNFKSAFLTDNNSLKMVTEE